MDRAYEKIFVAASIPVLRIAAGSQVVSANPAFLRRYGYTPSDFDHSPSLDRCISRDSDDAPTGLVFAGNGDAFMVSFEEIELATESLLIVDDGKGGSPIEERPAPASAEVLALFIEYAPAAIAMFDRNMCYVAASRKWIDDYHLDASTLVGLAHYEVFPEIGEKWKSVHRRGLDGEVLRCEEDPFARSDGSVQWIRWEVRPWRDNEGMVGGILIFSEDISALKNAEVEQSRLAGALRLMHEISVLNASEPDRWTFLGNICNLLAGSGEYAGAWIGYLEGERRLRLGGLAGRAFDAQSVSAIVKGPTLPRCCDLVLSEGTPLLIRDPSRECTGCNAVGIECGSSALAAPLRFRNHEYGVLVASTAAIIDKSGKELELFGEIAESIALALHAREIEDEQGRTSRALIESEVLFRGIFDQAAIGIGELDAEGKWLRVNRKFAEMLGYSHDELQGRGYRQLMKPDEAERILDALTSLGCGEVREVMLESSFETRSGINLPVSIAISLTKLSSQSPNRYTFVAADISGRKKAEAERQESRSKLKAAIESIADAISISDASGNFIDFNEAFATFHRFSSKEECAGTFAAYPGILDVSLEDGNLATVDQWAVPRALRGEIGTNVIYNLRRKDTGESWVGSYSFAPIRDEYGNMVGSIVVARDVTERLRTIEALIESERRFSRIFNSSPAAITISRFSDGTFLDVNDAYLRLFGFGRKEVVGSNAIKLQIWSTGQRSEIVLPLREKRHVDGAQVTARTKQGEIKHLLASLEMVDLNNEPCVLSILVDITERKQAEERLSRSLQEKDALLRELYHRTKNNMAVIIAMLDLQAAIIGDDNLTAAFTAAERRIQSMAIVHQKLYEAMDLSRINLGSYIRDLVEYARQSYCQTTSKVEIVEELQDVGILIDSAVPCSLVLNELLSNAFLHAFPGGRSGTIRVGLRKDEDDTIEIMVEDDGVGLPAGFDWQQGGQFGLQTVLNLGSYQLHGDISLASGSGVAWRVRFKDNLYQPRV